MNRPEIQAALVHAVTDMVQLRAGTHALCGAGHQFNEDEALDLILHQVQAEPAVHFLLMHTVTPAVVVNKGVNQPHVDLLRALFSRLVSKLATFAKEKIENFRHTQFAKKAGGTTVATTWCLRAKIVKIPNIVSTVWACYIMFSSR